MRTKALATPYPYPEHGFKDEIVEEVIEAYPDKGIATNMEAMILFAADDYDVLDVRSKAEIEYVGNYPTAKKNRAVGERFHMIPLINAKRKYDSKAGEKVYVQTKNEAFKEEIERTFPDKDAKIIVSCSDGRTVRFKRWSSSTRWDTRTSSVSEAAITCGTVSGIKT